MIVRPAVITNRGTRVGVVDGWDDEPDEEPEDGDRLGSRGKKIVVLVVSGLMLLTLVLCCMAVGAAGQLWWLQVPPP